MYFRTTCGSCDGQNITATGEERPAESREALDETDIGDALVADVDLNALAAESDMLNLLGSTDTTMAAETTITAPGETTTTALGETSETTSPDDSSTTSSSDQTSTTTVGSNSETTTGGTQTTAKATTSTTAAPSSTTAPPTTSAPPPTVGSNVPVSGSKIYVNPNGGNDGNAGSSEAAALKTIQSAFRRVQPGQTILLMGGDYRENKTPNTVHFHLWNKNGRSDAWIRIAAAPGHRPVLHANNGTGLLIQGDYVEVSGLEIRGSGFSQSNAWGVGISVTDSHHVRINGNRVSGMPVSGISAINSSNVHVVGNVVHENSYWSDVAGSGISFYNQANHGQGADAGQYHDLITNNRVYRNENKVPSKFQNHQAITDGNGIIVDDNQKSGFSGRTLVANNLSYDNGGRGIIVYRSNRVDVIFNTTYHNARTPGLIGTPSEIAAGRASDVKIHSNIGWARPGIHALQTNFHRGPGVDSWNNIWVSDSPTPTGDEAKDRLESSNPGLRNPTTGSGADFRPRSDSFLNSFAGSPNGMVPRDLVGTTRGSGSTEPGAFEVEASSGR